MKIPKIVLVWAMAFYATLVVFNNLTDYGSNFAFVAHVLRMDTTFADNQARWRALDSDFVHHALYWAIIAVEAAVAVLCWLGGLRLLRAGQDAGAFNRAKGTAIAGLTLGFALWFTGFITIGGEWFLMWQSASWNGQEAAFRLVVVFGIVLLFVSRTDSDADH